MGKASHKRREKERNTEWDRKPGETHLQWQSRITRMRQEERDRFEPIVPLEAEQHSEFVQEGMAKRNIGGTPLTRWKANKMLEDTQLAGIAYAIRIWDTLSKEPRTTANYGENVGGNSSDFESGRMLMARMEAQEDLERIIGKRDEFGVIIKKGYIPPSYWAVFENCIRYDEPTGFRGSKFGSPTQTAKTKAHTVVCFVADTICWKEGLTLDAKAPA